MVIVRSKREMALSNMPSNLRSFTPVAPNSGVPLKEPPPRISAQPPTEKYTQRARTMPLIASAANPLQSKWNPPTISARRVIDTHRKQNNRAPVLPNTRVDHGDGQQYVTLAIFLKGRSVTIQTC